MYSNSIRQQQLINKCIFFQELTVHQPHECRDCLRDHEVLHRPRHGRHLEVLRPSQQIQPSLHQPHECRDCLRDNEVQYRLRHGRHLEVLRPCQQIQMTLSV